MDQFHDFRHRVLRHLALLGASGTLFMAVYYFCIDSRWLGGACLIFAVAATGIFVDSRIKPQRSTLYGRVLVWGTLLLIWVAVYQDLPDVVNDPWLLVFPAIAFSLSSPTFASISIGIGLVGMFAVRQVQPHPISHSSALIVVFAYVLTSIVIAIFAFQNRKNVRMIRLLGETDPLTGVLNRRTLKETLETEFRRNLRQHGSMTVLMTDIDYFKPYNDRYGHPQGDEVLMKVANALKQAAKRSGDYVFRYGGEEFCVVCSGLVAAQAAAFAERLRASVAALDMPHEKSPMRKISISVGFCHADRLDRMAPENLVEAADQALYRAKARGRNCVEGQP